MTQLSENWSDGLAPTVPLDIRDGVIHYKLHDQEGNLRPATCKHTKMNELFVVWARKYDR